MEDCACYEALLSQSLDGPLSPGEQSALDAHLAQCPKCRELAGQLAQLREGFSAWADEEPPAELLAGVMERVRGEQRPKVVPLWRRPQVRALAGLAACAAVCIGLWGALTRGAGGGSDVMTVQSAGSLSAASDQAEEPALYSRAAAEEVPMVCALPPDAEADAEPAPEDGLALAAPEAAQAGFDKVQFLRVTWGSTPAAPSAQIMGSADSLERFLAQFPEDDLSEVKSEYDPEFFEENRLLVVVLEEPSGSIGHELLSVDGEQVTIRREVPETDAGDRSAWLILAQVDAGFEDGQTLEVRLEP